MVCIYVWAKTCQMYFFNLYPWLGRDETVPTLICNSLSEWRHMLSISTQDKDLQKMCRSLLKRQGTYSFKLELIIPYQKMPIDLLMKLLYRVANYIFFRIRNFGGHLIFYHRYTYS